MRKILSLIFLTCQLSAVPLTNLKIAFQDVPGVVIAPAPASNADVMIAFHGTGGSNEIAHTLRQTPQIHAHIVAFNFPEAGMLVNSKRQLDKVTYGTIQELFPALLTLKKVVKDAHADKVDLYGFSRGGGAVVNVIAILNRHQEDEALKSIGINEQDKKEMLRAIQKGRVVLDCPLKSMQEYADFNPKSSERILAEREKENHMVPIDNLADWKGLSLNILLFFQVPDEMLPNRDDELFIKRLKQVNAQGTNRTLRANNGGHLTYHPYLWNNY